MVIELKNISLIYKARNGFSLKNRLLNYKSLGVNDTSAKDYKALDDVSFKIEKGKVYGIIGNNGAGKSTLLRLLSGAVSPDSGEIIRNYGSINLLSLGVGFVGDLSGYDNIFLNAMLLGFDKKTIHSFLKEIIEYSELGDFISKPVRTYSSGMRSRLAFSIAIKLKPEVLLIDEILSVGDVNFREKSFNSLKEVISSDNTTVIMVNHDLNKIKELCSEAIYLKKGKLILKGNVEEVLARYNEEK